ncbi:MAG TPA: nuclease domain-containing protein [Chthonomonadaceae bacterium]|nr:nuclease domain-containing protein [Chthonomonadaceae bacterium]
MGREAVLRPAERRRLLEDIGQIGLALGRDMAAGPLFVSPSGPPLQEGQAAPLERIRLLEALWAPAPAALRAIVRQPDRRIEAQTVLMLPARSSGSPATAAAIARTPGGKAAWAALQGEEQAPGTPLLPDRRARVTAETPANRLAVTLLTDLEREAEMLAAQATAWGEAEEAARAGHVARAARCWRRRTFLQEIGPLAAWEQTGLLTINALRCEPPYRALLRLYRALRQPLHIEEEAAARLALPSLPDWRLYEIWCFFMVAGALRHLGWRAAEGEPIRRQADGLTLTLATGRASRLRFTHRPEGGRKTANRGQAFELDLYYQPLFVSANRQATGNALRSGREDLDTTGLLPGYASLSHAMQPDIALCCRDRLYLLDPKFRAYALSPAEGHADPFPVRQSSALQEDINKMHAYRDAIVRGGRPAVAAGWCLFPGEPGPASGPDVLAYPSSTPSRPFGTAGVGALRLRPGGGQEGLERLIASWLAGESRQPEDSGYCVTPGPAASAG